MRSSVHLVAFLAALAACGGADPAPPSVATSSPTTPVSPTPTPPKPDEPVAQVTPPAKPSPKPEAPLEGHDFTPEARVLAAVGACVDGPTPEGYDAKLIAAHCKKIDAVQDEYAKRWVAQAAAFFAEKVPQNAPKTVVYPFSGGDLSTALTVFPDADEITTLSLEPAGDPRTLGMLNEAATKPTGKSKRPNAAAKRALEKALGTVRYELNFLYRVNFSNTRNMIDAMRGGLLPTQLIFGLSALKVHGYELVSLRYFTLDEAGKIHYLTDEEVAAAPDPMAKVGDTRAAGQRNNIFSNSEIRFRKPGGKIQVHRHIRQNLGDKELAADPRVIKHLEAKGTVVGMTKAASYLLSWDSFATMRNYLLGHVVWMVSDATGVAPRWGTAAGFEYETYGGFNGPHLDAGNGVAKNWRTLWSSQPKRPLKFRFGYYDNKTVDHLVIMKKKS